MPLPLVLGACLALSCLLNAYQLLRFRRRPTRDKFDITATDLLHDLTRRGQALVRVEVIDPANLMLRSPRG